MPKLFKLIFVIVFFVIIQNKVVAQQVEFRTIRNNGEKFTQKSAQLISSNSYVLDNEALFTSLLIQIDKSQNFNGAFLLVENDTFFLTKDEHVNANNGLINSNLISFDQPVSTIQFYTSQIENSVLFNFINGSVGLLGELQVEKNIESNCLTEPSSIEQQMWRNGLQAPEYNRSFSTVKHLIIHHSAGSNTNTNYTQVVRDIYIYHTEVNGWSDIGYNYLIAQDGTIYKGRDPENGEQANVRGAHFCGMNTGTMGVCLLGDYSSIAPTNNTIQSLLNLISWKLDKEKLNAFESFSLSSILNLGSISGHRDGCATECPGTHTYNKMANFKSQANSIIESCYPDKLIADFTWSNEEIVEGESISFTDTSEGTPLSWEWEIDGSADQTYTIQNPSNVVYPNTGEFDVSLIVRNGARTDTALVNNLIRVSENPFSNPSAFPNPISNSSPLLLNLNKDEINKVEVVDSKGEKVLDFTPIENRIEIDHTSFNSGIYYIRFFSNDKVVQSTKIVNIK